MRTTTCLLMAALVVCSAGCRQRKPLRVSTIQLGRSLNSDNSIGAHTTSFRPTDTIYVSILGKRGLRKVGELSTAKAHYAAQRLAQVPGVSLRFTAPFFKEFTLKLPKSPDRVVGKLVKHGILGGVPLKSFDRRLADCLLVAVTEKRTKAEIDLFADALTKAVA